MHLPHPPPVFPLLSASCPLLSNDFKQALNRLQKRDAPTDDASPRTEIVIQEPKTENSVRDIPLLAPVVADLLNWRKVQEQDRMTLGEAYMDSGFIVTNPQGSFIEPRTFSDYYSQVLKLAGLRHFTFHALRHTFASRAMEQGMDEKTLSTILGHYSVSFTLDITSEEKARKTGAGVVKWKVWNTST